MSRKMIIIEIAATFIAIVLCCAFLRKDVYHNVKQWGLENNIEGKNNYYSSMTGVYQYGYWALTEGTEIVQKLQLTESMLKDESLKVSLYFGTFQRENRGKLYVELVQGEKCQTQMFEVEDVKEGQPFSIDYELSGLEKGSVCLKIYATETTEDSCIAAYIRIPRQDRLVGMDMESEKKENPSAMFSYVLVNGIEQNGPLAMEIYTYTK